MSFLSSLRRAVLTGACLLGLSALPSHAATFTVSNLNDSGAGSLRQAIDLANAKPDADTITFASTLKGTITLQSGELPLTSNLAINGPGANVLTISGNNTSRIFNVTGVQVTVSGVTLTGGKQIGIVGASEIVGAPGGSGGSVKGGAIYNTGTLSLTDVVLTGNSVVGGEGGKGVNMYRNSNEGGPITGYPAQPGGVGGIAQGGAIFNGGTLALVGTRFQNNSALGGRGGNGGKRGITTIAGGAGGDAQGGAICNGGQLSQHGTTFQGNKVVAGAGGQTSGASGKAQENNIYTFDVTPIANDATFDLLQGRAVHAQLVVETQGLPLTYSLVSGTLPAGLTLNAQTGFIGGRPQTPTSGRQVTYQATNRRHTSNVATITFNVTAADPPSYTVTTTADDSTYTDGKTSLREAIETANFDAQAELKVGAITFNLPADTPPTIVLKQGKLIPRANTSIKWTDGVPLTVKGDTGIFEVDKGTLNLSGITITGATKNPAVDVKGGATLNISNCTISNNRATELGNYGGALYNEGALNISNCTISGNLTQYYGAAIANYGNASVVNSTICNNSAAEGGGIYNKGTLAVDSCTLTGNRSINFSGQVISGGIYSEGSATINNSIIVGNSPTNSNVAATNSLVAFPYEKSGLDPRGLQYNGGPTQTIALVAGSPAIDAGRTSLATDQRGIKRPQSKTSDIGAFEFQLLPTLSVDSSSVKEGNSGKAALIFTFTLSQASSSGVSVIVNTRQGTAKSGSDYVSVPSATVTFAPGTTKQTFTVQVIGDTLVESDEQFQLTLRSPVNATLGTSIGTGTIVNDDTAPKSNTFAGSAPSS